MELKKFKVTDECIACGACVEIALNNFSIGDSGLAYVKKQPEDEQELRLVEEAAQACPVGAIVEIDQEAEDNGAEPILASSNVKETLDKYPQLKDVLMQLSPKFKRLQNPVMYNTLAKFITFSDAARVTGVSICEILHVLNKHLGTEKKLHEIMPDCIKEKSEPQKLESDELTWDEPAERYVYNSDTMPELMEKVRSLEPQQAIVMIAVDKPVELIKVARGLGYKVNVEYGRDWRISIFNPQPKQQKIDRSKFDVLDVRQMRHDPFDEIMKKSYQIGDGHGFVLVQRFVPYPIINMLTEMGFEAEVDQVAPDEVKVYFYKKPQEYSPVSGATEKIDVVIQSATPVAYPVIMRLLQSERLREHFNIRDLKVWEETEKHLAWITNGKADISFSALLTSLKIYRFGVKIPALFVWDNFVLLSRRKNVQSFADLRGEEIHLPLFNEAPPARITRYLIKATGNNPDDYKFVFGKPFGRPEQIYQDFITGRATNVVLREPEASYAVKIMQDRGEEFSEVSFNELWNKVNPGFGSFPNAGVVIKEEFFRKHPEKSKIFLEELKAAIDWVNANHKEAALLSFDMMRQPVDRVELFLERVNFEYKSGEELLDKVRWYFDILYRNGIIDKQVPDEFYDIFRI